jgi:hypothetical protein
MSLYELYMKRQITYQTAVDSSYDPGELKRILQKPA